MHSSIYLYFCPSANMALFWSLYYLCCGGPRLHYKTALNTRACKALHSPFVPSTMGCWAIADGSSRLIVTEPRARTLNGTTQAGPGLIRAVRDYVRAHERRHGRRKTAEDLGVSRHTLWRFLERGHVGSAVPSAVLNAVGGNVTALKAATLEIIIDLEGLRPDPALRPLHEGLEEALLLLCATPLATVDELSSIGRIPASTLRDRPLHGQQVALCWRREGGSVVALATQVPEGLSALLNEITLEALAKRPHRASSSRGRTGDNRRQSGPAYWRAVGSSWRSGRASGPPG